jgi:hypothetical protein
MSTLPQTATRQSSSEGEHTEPPPYTDSPPSYVEQSSQPSAEEQAQKLERARLKASMQRMAKREDELKAKSELLDATKTFYGMVQQDKEKAP